MTNPGGRAVSMMEPGDRRKSGRFFEGPWSIDSASDPEPGEARNYARHARSIPARRLRQRALMLAVAGGIVVAVAVFAGPSAVRLLTTKRPNPSTQAVVKARRLAVGWITRWVSDSATISCDPLICQDLHKRGIQADRLVRIGVDTQDPQNSDVVVATQAIRDRFGSKLAGVFAPAVLGRFGAGNARIDIRFVQNYGEASRFRRALRADERARRAAGSELLRNANVTAPPAAADELAAGRVDSRILATLPALARICRLRILRFGGAAPRASRGMPLLSIALTVADSAGNSAGYASVQAPKQLAVIMKFLKAQILLLRPARCRELRSPEGVYYIRIDFAAPTVLVFHGST